MTGIPTEPIGSIPRSPALLAALEARAAGRMSQARLQEVLHAATVDTLRRFAASGSPVVSDGEQGKFDSFLTYGVHGMANLTPGGFRLPFADGHERILPRLTAGPFRYRRYADGFLRTARGLTALPVKQAVISASALSLLYPVEGLPDYGREDFLSDLLNEHETDIRRCLAAGAHSVQVDFTEGRLALRLDPGGGLLADFVDLNNLVLERLAPAERALVGVHTCPGSDRDSTHSAEVDYADLFPCLFELLVTNFYVQLASEPEPERVLRLIARHLRPGQRVFVGVVDPLSPRVERVEEVRDRVLAAARHIPPDQLGTTDDCGFAPFAMDISTSRDTAFAKIAARVEGTRLAERVLAG